jgi:hypothetical protein
MGNNERVGIKVTFELEEDGYYITVNSKKHGESEFMGMSYDLPYFISILNIMLDRAVHLSGKDVRVL